jgi:hypothetical protein
MRLGLQDRWLKSSGLCRRCARNGLLFQKNDHFSKVIQFIDLCDRDDLFLVRGAWRSPAGYSHSDMGFKVMKSVNIIASSVLATALSLVAAPAMAQDAEPRWPGPDQQGLVAQEPRPDRLAPA